MKNALWIPVVVWEAGEGIMPGKLLLYRSRLVGLGTLLCVTVLTLLASVENAHATTYYVSTSGTDSNSCATSTSSGASAKRNILGASGAVACMASGDTL